MLLPSGDAAFGTVSQACKAQRNRSPAVLVCAADLPTAELERLLSWKWMPLNNIAPTLIDPAFSENN